MCHVVVLCYVLFCYLVLSSCDSPILIFTMVALVQFLPVSNKGLFPLVLAITCCRLFSWCSDWGGIDSLSSFKRQKISTFWRQSRVGREGLTCISLTAKGMENFLKKFLLAWELPAQLTTLLADKKIYLFNSVVFYRLSILLLPHLKDRWQIFLPFYSLSTLTLVSFPVQFSVFQVIPLVNY